MDTFKVQMHLALIMAITSSFVNGNVIADRSSTETVNSKKLRAKRHVVFDNDKLCKAVGCVNGYCRESELRKYRIVCECFTGYEGTLCDKLKCPYDCGKHGTCSRKGPILYCKCDQGYYGAKCDSFVQTHSKLSKHKASKTLLKALGGMLLGSPHEYSNPNAMIAARNSWLAHTASPKHIKFSEFHSHAEIDTSVKPDICAPGFQCYHGHCDREALNHGLFRCHCKANYTGLFCNKRCTLNCQNGGTCMVMIDGHQKCSCPFNFTGYYCEKVA